MNADRIAAAEPVRRAPMPFTGHGTVRMVTESKLGVRLIETALGDAPRFRRLLRSGRTQSLTYMREKSKALLARELGRTTGNPRFLNRQAEVAENVGLAALAEALVLFRSGETAAAEAHLWAASNSDLISVEVIQAWRAFRNSRFASGEARMAGLLRAAYPDNAFFRLQALNTWLDREEIENSLAELDAISALPDALEQVSHFIVFYLRARRPDRAAQIHLRWLDDPASRGADTTAATAHLIARLEREGAKAEVIATLRTSVTASE